jgi:hypothetical protein
VLSVNVWSGQSWKNNTNSENAELGPLFTSLCKPLDWLQKRHLLGFRAHRETSICDCLFLSQSQAWSPNLVVFENWIFSKKLRGFCEELENQDFKSLGADNNNDLVGTWAPQNSRRFPASSTTFLELSELRKKNILKSCEGYLEALLNIWLRSCDSWFWGWRPKLGFGTRTWQRRVCTMCR